MTVDLVGAQNLMAADKTGTSDPYVVFTVNGERVHKSETIRKTLNPRWQRERFTVPIVSSLIFPSLTLISIFFSAIKKSAYFD